MPTFIGAREITRPTNNSVKNDLENEIPTPNGSNTNDSNDNTRTTEPRKSLTGVFYRKFPSKFSAESGHFHTTLNETFPNQIRKCLDHQISFGYDRELGWAKNAAPVKLSHKEGDRKCLSCVSVPQASTRMDGTVLLEKNESQRPAPKSKRNAPPKRRRQSARRKVRPHAFRKKATRAKDSSTCR